MTALYVLSAEYREAAEKLADLELPPEVIADTLEGMSGDLEVKALNVAMFSRNLDVTAVAIKEAEKQMAARRKAIEKRSENLRTYLLTCMRLAGIKKISSPQFDIARRTNPASVEIFESKMIPAQYMRQPEPPPPAPDKIAISRDLKAGIDVPGARLVDDIERVEIK